MAVNFTAVTKLKNNWQISKFSLTCLLPAEIGVAHQLQGGLLLGDLDVLHELPFSLVARNLHDGDGRDPRQVHIRCAATACCVGLHQVAFLDQPTLLFAILDVGDLDLLRDARLACNLLDEVVHLLFVGSRQPVVVLLQDGLQLGADRNDDVVADLLLLEVDDLLPRIRRSRSKDLLIFKNFLPTFVLQYPI